MAHILDMLLAGNRVRNSDEDGDGDGDGDGDNRWKNHHKSSGLSTAAIIAITCVCVIAIGGLLFIAVRYVHRRQARRRAEQYRLLLPLASPVKRSASLPPSPTFSPEPAPLTLNGTQPSQLQPSAIDHRSSIPLLPRAQQPKETQGSTAHSGKHRDASSISSTRGWKEAGPSTSGKDSDLNMEKRSGVPTFQEERSLPSLPSSSKVEAIPASKASQVTSLPHRIPLRHQPPPIPSHGDLMSTPSSSEGTPSQLARQELIAIRNPVSGHTEDLVLRWPQNIPRKSSTSTAAPSSSRPQPSNDATEMPSEHGEPPPYSVTDDSHSEAS